MIRRYVRLPHIQCQAAKARHDQHHCRPRPPHPPHSVCQAVLGAHRCLYSQPVFLARGCLHHRGHGRQPAEGWLVGVSSCGHVAHLRVASARGRVYTQRLGESAAKSNGRAERHTHLAHLPRKCGDLVSICMHERGTAYKRRHHPTTPRDTR